MKRVKQGIWLLVFLFILVPVLGACQAGSAATATPAGVVPTVTISAEQTISANLYLIALEDDGQNGPAVGCGDSLVPITVEITSAENPPLAQTLQALLDIEESTEPGSGLYNALYQSDLTVSGVTIENGQATISLTGGLLMGGTCDVPRVEGQLLETALQFEGIDSVNYLINDIPLEEWLDARG